MSNAPIPPDNRPIWKRDFPYDAAAEEDVSRREFTRYLVLGAGAMATANVVLAAWTQLRVINSGEPREIAAIADIAVGGSYLFEYPTDRDPAVLVRLGENEVVAFSQKCTHLGCVVYHQPDEQRWHCPCHEGHFDTRTGQVLSGPPTRPLGRINVEIRADGRIWALGRSE